MTTHIGVMVGSNAPDSLNRRLAAILTEHAPATVELVDLPIHQLPLYDRGYDGSYPPDAQDLKRRLAAVDALLIVSPEHNRSIPAVVTNAISWASRPTGENALAGKRAAMAGISPGASGTMLMQSHLRVVLAQLGVDVLAQPTLYLSKDQVLADDGSLLESAVPVIEGFWDAYAAFLAR